MDQEDLFWITISSYYYLYIVYSLLVDQSLFREIQDTDLHLVYKYSACPKTSVFIRCCMKSDAPMIAQLTAITIFCIAIVFTSLFR